MMDTRELIERAKGCLDVGEATGSRGKHSSNVYNVLAETIAALSSQAAEIERLMDALTAARDTFVVEYGADGKPLTVGYDGNALRPLIAVLDAALTPKPNKEA